MARRRLIFFVTADPAANPAALTSAYRFGATATAAGLDAEVRLAGDAVLVADPAHVASVGHEDLRDRVDAAPPLGVTISVCPNSARARGIHAEQVAAIGARPRELSEILIEVAEGRSVLIPVQVAGAPA